ncbi:MAG: PD-(D/E)XK nuclease family protein [Christensenellales bacterium]|jgi:ATP-dependent helicase/nuclease subunit B
MLKLVLGRAGSGKSHYMMQQMARAQKARGGSILYIVPQQFTHQAERLLLSRTDLPGLLDIEVLSFARLCTRILDETGGLATPRISDSGRAMLYRAALGQIKDGLIFYRQSASRGGFAARLAVQRAELDAFCVTTEDLRQAASSAPTQHLKQKLSELALLLDTGDEALHTRALSTDNLALEVAGRLQQSALIRDALIFVDDLESLTPQYATLLFAMMQVCREMTVSFCIDPDDAQHPRYDIQRGMMARVTDMARDSLWPVETVKLPQRRRDVAPELVHLEANLFHYPAKPYGGPAGAIHLSAAQTPDAEADTVAAQIVALCRDNGLRYGDIAVILTDVDMYRPHIEQAFARCGIPAFYDFKRPVRGSGAMSALQRLLSMCVRPWQSGDIFSVLKTGLTYFADDLIFRMENYVLARGIQGARRWHVPWDVEEADADIEQARRELTAILDPYLDAMRRDISVCARIDLVFDTLTALRVQENLENLVAQLNENGFHEAASETAQVWDALCEALSQLGTAMAKDILGCKDFLLMLEEGLFDVELGIIPTTVDQVTVSSFRRYRAGGVKALFVLGASAAAMAQAPETEGLLSPEDIDILKEGGLSVGFTKRHRNQQKKWDTYMALTRATQALSVSYCLSDISGAPQNASPLMIHLLALFPGLKRIRPMNTNLLSTAEGAYPVFICNIRRERDGLSVPGWLRDAKAYYLGQPQWQERAASLFDALELRPDTHLEQETVRALFPRPLTAAVTQLERFARCPFSHMAAYGLKARERAVYESGQHRDTGTLLHEVMHRLSMEIMQGRIDPGMLERRDSDAWVERTFGELASGSDIYLSILREQSPSSAALKDRLESACRDMAWAMVESLKYSLFRPWGAEIDLGSASMPAVTVPLGGGEEARLSGRIDRVDGMRLEDGRAALRIVDYKSGHKSLSPEEVFYGLKLQLPAYLMALSDDPQRFGADDVTAAGMLYFNLVEPGYYKKPKKQDDSPACLPYRMDGLVLEDEAVLYGMDTTCENGKGSRIANLGGSHRLAPEYMHRLLAYTRQKLGNLARGIAAGDARVYPSRRSREFACTYCPYKGVCAYDQRLMPPVNYMPPMGKPDNVLEKMGKEKGHAPSDE